MMIHRKLGDVALMLSSFVILLSICRAHNSLSGSICPSWFMYDNDTGQCVCGDNFGGIVNCNGNRAYVINCYCMSYVKETGTVVGSCSANCILEKKFLNVSFQMYYQVPVNPLHLNEALCGERWNRSGRFCGKCRDGHYPLVYSYDMNCIECTTTDLKYNWVKFVLVAFVPLTFFFVFILSFGISATSPPLDAFVLFAQTIATPANVRLLLEGVESEKYSHFQIVCRFIAMLYGVWNLDFFRTLWPPICLKLTTLQALALDYVIALYPLILIAITYILIVLYDRPVRLLVWVWKPFKAFSRKFGVSFNIKVSVIKVFGTFLLLSYIKLLGVSFDLLVFVKAYDPSGKAVGMYLYYDATTDYFGKDHLPYAIVAIVVTIAFILLPLLLTLLYPLKCFKGLTGKWPALHIYFDSFQGYYKDGTEGTRDYRYFSSFHLIIRITLFLVYSFFKNAYFYPFSAILLLMLVILIAVIKPFKPQFGSYNLIHILLLLNLVVWFITIQCIHIASLKASYINKVSAALSVIVAVVPLIYVSCLSVKWIYVRIRLQKYCVKHFNVCQRKDEGNGNEETRSVDSLPYRIDHAESNRQPLHPRVDNIGNSDYGAI